MKNPFLILLTFLILNSCSAGLKCCTGKSDVVELLTGYWKEKNSDSKSIYEYSFEKRQGHYIEVEPSENMGEYFIIDDHPFVDIIKNGRGFDLKFTDLSGSRISKIRFLDERKLILEMEGINVEFNRVAK